MTSRVLWQGRDNGQFHQNFRFAQLGFDRCACRLYAFRQPLVPNTVHAGKVGVDVFEIDGDRQDVAFVGAGQVQQVLDILQGFASLLLDPGVHVIADLPGQVNSTVVSHDLAHAFIGELALDCQV